MVSPYFPFFLPGQEEADPYKFVGYAPAGHAQLLAEGGHPAVRRLQKSVEFLEAPLRGDPDEDIQELGGQAPSLEVIVNDDGKFPPALPLPSMVRLPMPMMRFF